MRLIDRMLDSAWGIIALTLGGAVALIAFIAVIAVAIDDCDREERAACTDHGGHIREWQEHGTSCYSHKIGASYITTCNPTTTTKWECEP